ncbi:MAG: hypothetical protein D4S01_11290 [Dehalococcoidia bacterium]|nr:MAG: hypothetical protein D4S01_11290 [Dehalococcoidia bacterium]
MSNIGATSTVSGNKLNGFPSQKRTSNQKTKRWYEDCIDAMEALIYSEYSSIRSSFHNKKINFALANDKVSKDEFMKVFNTYGFDTDHIPASMDNHYNVSMNKIALLAGEEEEMPFEWQLISTSPDSVTEKEKTKKQMLDELAMRAIQNKNISEEEIQKELQEIERYANYTYQDIREKTGDIILRYLYKKLNVRRKMSRNFLNELLVGENLYRTDIVAGEPVGDICNPLKLATLQNGDSPFLEDAEQIVEIDFLPTGAVIDEFYEDLSPSDIEYLDNGYNSSSDGRDLLSNSDLKPLRSSTFTVSDLYGDSDNDLITSTNSAFSGYFDINGQVRVLRCRWKSRLKRYKHTYFDDFGEKQEEIVSENYKLTEEQRNNSESLKELWIDVWEEGTKIADKIYVKCQQRPIQFRERGNISKCSSGYVGTYNNINSNKAISLMDRMKPYQYLYNVFMRRYEIAMARHHLPMLVLNTSLKPSNLTDTQWMKWAMTDGILQIDPFNPINEGSMKGKVAGSVNQFMNQYINPNMGNYIQIIRESLVYLESMISKVSGVSESREGYTQNSDTVGGIERSVKQSALITQPYYNLHFDTATRFMSTLLETAKIAYADKDNLSIPYITDNYKQNVYNVDGTILNESEYDIFVSSSTKDYNVKQSLKGLSQQYLSSGGSMEVVIDILRNESISDVSRKLIEETNSIKEQQSEQFQAEMKARQEGEQAKSDLEKYKIDIDAELQSRELDIKEAEMHLNAGKTLNDSEKDVKMRELTLKERMAAFDASYKENELKEKERSNKAKEEIAKKSKNNK